jgi:hypothetical protein
VGRDSTFDISTFNIIVLYVLNSDADSTYASFNEIDNSIITNSGTSSEELNVFKGVNVYVNSPIYKTKSTSVDHESRLLPNYNWIKHMFNTIKIFNGGDASAF